VYHQQQGCPQVPAACRDEHPVTKQHMKARASKGTPGWDIDPRPRFGFRDTRLLSPRHEFPGPPNGACVIALLCSEAEMYTFRQASVSGPVFHGIAAVLRRFPSLAATTCCLFHGLDRSFSSLYIHR